MISRTFKLIKTANLLVPFTNHHTFQNFELTEMLFNHMYSIKITDKIKNQAMHSNFHNK